MLLIRRWAFNKSKYRVAHGKRVALFSELRSVGARPSLAFNQVMSQLFNRG